jgi:hypothetical protein
MTLTLQKLVKISNLWFSYIFNNQDMKFAGKFLCIISKLVHKLEIVKHKKLSSLVNEFGCESESEK